eukprot:COSAG06_NODE_36065_length_452_cov_0.866856_2_plen_87_part_01
MVPAPLPPAEAAAQAGGEGRPLAQPGECSDLLPVCVVSSTIDQSMVLRRLCACCVGMLCVLLWLQRALGGERRPCRLRLPLCSAQPS